MGIEFKKVDKNLVVLLDGSVLDEVEPSKSDSDYGSFHFETDDHEVAELMFHLFPRDIPDKFNFFFGYECEENPQITWLSYEKKVSGLTIEVSYPVELNAWAYPFTVIDYTSLLISRLSKIGYKAVFSEESGSIYIMIYFEANEEKIADQANQFSGLVLSVSEAVISTLLEKSSTQIFSRVFNFPEGYENVCSQYLMWFGDFLKTLGVEADVSVRNSTNRTILIAAPQENESLITEIEKAFYTYLSLPYAEYLPLERKEEDAETALNYKMLELQVSSFRTQMQVKDALIEQKDGAINLLKSECDKKDKEIMLLSSLEKTSHSDVELLGGTLSISEYKWGPFKINPKKALDLLKNK